MTSHGTGDDIDVVETRYVPEQQESLTDVLFDAIEEFKGEDISDSDFILYDEIDPDALDTLFRHTAEPRTTVIFVTDDVRVELYGDDGVVVTVRERQLV